MVKSLNVQALADALPRTGLSPAKLAERIGVSRAAVSKWMTGKSVPQPDKLLRLGMILDLSFDNLVVASVPEAVPVVSFRRKAARKTRDSHLENAREIGELLKRLVKYLPETRLTQAPVLKEPRCDYDYVQKVADDIRSTLGQEGRTGLEFTDLIGAFNRLQAVIVPALWGEKQHHGNALNIYLPDSGTTWVFLNLDSNGIDFKFWMAHELGHALAPTLGEDAGEDFADAFAQALLYPDAVASRFRSVLLSMNDVARRVVAVHEEAAKRIISPYTIRRAIVAYETARGLPPVDMGAEGAFMGAVKNFSKGYKTITQTLFGTVPPNPAQYAASGKKHFGSPFFETLAGFCRAETGGEHLIHQILGLPLANAKALSGELAK
jgi:transcriptional regulator with XRE-family HTH domain